MNKLFDLYDLLDGKLYANKIFDIICISETWLRHDISDSIITNGRNYNICRFDRPHDRIGGGVCILTNDKLISTHIPISNVYNEIEICCVEQLVARLRSLNFPFYGGDRGRNNVVFCTSKRTYT